MTVQKIPVEDVGTIFRSAFKTAAGVVIDISAATAKELIFTASDGVQVTKAATFTTDGTDGQIEYKRLVGDIVKRGTWTWRGKVTLGAGDIYSAAIPTAFEVVE